MRKLMTVLVLILVGANSSSAGPYDYPLDVSLQTPSRPWINLEDCKEMAEDTFLKIGWSLPSNPLYLWDTTQKANVFFSVSEDCLTPSKEIGETDEEVGDIEIAINQNSGLFPKEGDELTLADLIADKQINCDSNEEKDYFLCIHWEFEEVVYTDTQEISYSGGAPIRLDFNAPDPPTLLSVSSGENNLKVSWENPDDEDLGGFEIDYRPEGAPDSAFDPISVTDKTKTRYTITGLENGTTYEIRMRAVDESENQSTESESKFGTPQPVEDFFELYKNSGGMEEGGYCFVATAAYGSYQDGMVRPLREFRETVLSKSAIGRSVVKKYYQYGPLWARALEGSDTTKSLTRFWLLPVVGFAWLSGATGPVTACILVLLMLMLAPMLLIMLVRHRHRAFARNSVSLLLVAGCLLGTLPKAQASEESNYQLQMRFGFYYPKVDNESYPGLIAGQEKPFQNTFGSDSKFMFELGIDYQIWKGFGTVTTGGTVGFVQYLGKALTEDGNVSSDTTVFNLIPFRLNIGYHFDYLEQHMGVPLVPYVSGGISYYLWWVLDGVGNVARWVDEETGSKYNANGGIFGYHFAVGLKFLLDVLEPDAAANLAVDVGIYNTFLFGEYTISKVDGFGSGNHMNLGDEAFMFGLMMEF